MRIVGSQHMKRNTNFKCGYSYKLQEFKFNPEYLYVCTYTYISAISIKYSRIDLNHLKEVNIICDQYCVLVTHLSSVVYLHST